MHFKTNSHGDTKTVGLNGFDLSCNTPAVVYNMNQPAKGDISAKFIPYTTAINLALIKETFSAKHDQISATKEEMQTLAVYPESVRCK